MPKILIVEDDFDNMTLVRLLLEREGYQVLLANDDARFVPCLTRAYEMLQERANDIQDPAMRRAFLENVPEDLGSEDFTSKLSYKTNRINAISFLPKGFLLFLFTLETLTP